MTDWRCVLRAIAPKGKGWIINGVADAMPEMIRIADLSTPRRLVDFLAQTAHESDGFATTKEYASGAAYEGRHDIGNTHRGDGVRFKGRGIIQNTGRGGYEILISEFASIGMKLDLLNHPEILEKFPYAALAAAFFWKRKRLNRFADNGNFNEETRLINGGYNGLAQRQAYRKAAMRVLATPEPSIAPAEAVTAADLRQAGSRTMAATAQVKNNTALAGGAMVASGALEAVSNATSQVSDTVQTAQSVVSNVQNVHEATKSASTVLVWLHAHWPHLLIGANVILALACAWFVWRIWHGAQRVERARVDDANAAFAAAPAVDAAPEEEAPAPRADKRRIANVRRR